MLCFIVFCVAVVLWAHAWNKDGWIDWLLNKMVRGMTLIYILFSSQLDICVHSDTLTPNFHWYSLHLPREEWSGWVYLGCWLHTEMVTHHKCSLIQVQTGVKQRAVTFIDTNVLLLSQIATNIR